MCGADFFVYEMDSDFRKLKDHRFLVIALGIAESLGIISSQYMLFREKNLGKYILVKIFNACRRLILYIVLKTWQSSYKFLSLFSCEHSSDIEFDIYVILGQHFRGFQNKIKSLWYCINKNRFQSHIESYYIAYS